jgi:hypothetical protein
MADTWDDFEKAPAKAPAADPWSEFETAKAKPKPSRIDAFVQGAKQGATLALGDEIQGKNAEIGSRLDAMYAAGFPRSPSDPEYPTPKRLEKWYPQLDPLARAGQYRSDWLTRHGFKDWADVSTAQNAAYLDPAHAAAGREVRNEERASDKAAREAHPGFYAGGSLAGSAPLAALIPASTPGTLGAKMLAGIKAGAPLGAAYGFGGSEAEGAGGKILDAAAGGLLGATAGAALPALGAGAGKVLRPVAEKLSKRAVDLGRNAISGVINSLSRRKPIPEEAVKAAMDAGVIRFGSNVEGIANRAQNWTEGLSDDYTAILKELADRGVHGPEAEKLANSVLADARTAVQNSAMGGSSGGPYAAALKEAGESIGSRALPVSGKGRLGLMQAEEMKKGLQSRAASEYVKEGATSLAGQGRKETAARVREAIEQAVQDQSGLAPEAAARFEPVKESLHQALNVLGPAREGAARLARRQPIGLHEAMGLASGLATGDPIKAITNAGILHALKTRGASAGAVTARNLSRLLGGTADVAEAPVRAAPAMTPYMSRLSEALERRFGLAPALADEEGP